MRRHEFDAVAFVFGLLFAAAGLLLLGGNAVRDGLVLPWVGPAVAIGLGVVIVIGARPRGAAPAEGAAAGDRADGTAPADHAAGSSGSAGSAGSGPRG